MCSLYKSTVQLFVITVCLMFTPNVTAKKLMVILIDGFRWDYFNIHGMGLRGFPMLFDQGTKAEYTIVDFPTLSYPNYYSIMTGLYNEAHGMVANNMYDSKMDEEFLIGTNPEYNQSYWWDGGDPVWITATRQKKNVRMYYWPNCEVAIRGLKPAFCDPYIGVPTLEDFTRAINQGLVSLKDGTADMIGIYFELTDKYGHWFGPRSSQVRKVVQEVDEEIYQLLKKLERMNLKEDVDLMIFSEHGMTAVSPLRSVSLEDYVNVTDVERILEDVAFMGIWPKEGKLSKLYSSLKGANEHMRVYKREETPIQWHFRQHYRIPPLVISMELGWTILKPNETYWQINDTVQLKGAHGYDNMEVDMRGIFLLTGPSFKVAHMSGPVNVVDIYQIMCSSIEIKPSPNNGSWARISEVWRTSTANSFLQPHWLLFLTTIVLSRLFNSTL